SSRPSRHTQPPPPTPTPSSRQTHSVQTCNPSPLDPSTTASEFRNWPSKQGQTIVTRAPSTRGGVRSKIGNTWHAVRSAVVARPIASSSGDPHAARIAHLDLRDGFFLPDFEGVGGLAGASALVWGAAVAAGLT